MGNGSLDFLNMIKNGMEKPAPALVSRPESAPAVKGIPSAAAPTRDLIAVIDTETNWRNEVMSLGVALADAVTFKCVGQKYYIFDPECRVGGMYSRVMYKGNIKPVTCSRDEALSDLGNYLMDNNVQKILAYNATFDYGHLPELKGFEWYDIMRLAAYRQYNPFIPDELPCCKSGRLKSNFGVEPILRMLSGNNCYCEVHNAVLDAIDELKIVELLGQELSAYECGKIN